MATPTKTNQLPEDLEAEPNALSEDEWERRLSQSGVLAEIPVGHRPGARREFRPVKIEGAPLSVTVIRERR